MPKTLASIAALVLGLATLAFAADKPKDGDKPAPKPINKTCPVEDGHEIDPKVTYTFNGKVIGFCCADCIDEFKKDPEKYMKKIAKGDKGGDKK